MGRPLGGDFVEFYTVGKILNNYAPARIYDLALAVRLQHASAADHAGDADAGLRADAIHRAGCSGPSRCYRTVGVRGVARIFGRACISPALAFLFSTVRLKRGGSQNRLSAGSLVDAVSCLRPGSAGRCRWWSSLFGRCSLWCLENDRRFLAGLAFWRFACSSRLWWRSRL